MKFRQNLINQVLALALLLLLSFIYLFLPPLSDQPGFLSDSARYLFMAEYFGYSSDWLVRSIFHTSIFPPLFPIAISIFGPSAVSAHYLSTAFFLLASIPFFYWLKTFLTDKEALLITGVTWCAPILLRTSLDILSESLFIFLTFIAFRITRSPHRREVAISLAFTISLAILTRSIGVALLPGLIIWLWAGRKQIGGSALLMAIFTLLAPIFAWELYKTLSRPGGNEVSYVSVIIDLLRNDFTGLLGVIAENVDAFLKVGLSNGGVYLHVILLILAIPTFAKRLIELSFDATFLLCYVAIILIWPFPLEMTRFMVVIIPIIVVYALITSSRLASRSVTQREATTGLFSLLLFLMFLPSNIHQFNRMKMEVDPIFQVYQRSSHWVSIADEDEAMKSLVNMHRLSIARSHVGKTVEENECVYALFADLLSYQSRRRTVQMPTSVEEMTECRYVFASVQTSMQFEFEPMFPVLAEGFENRTPLWASIDDNNEPVAALFDLKLSAKRK
jgi:hypothetical protein